MEGEEDPKKFSKKFKKKGDPKGIQEETSETETASHESGAQVKPSELPSQLDSGIESTLLKPPEEEAAQNGKNPKKSRSGNSTPKSPLKTSKSPSKKISENLKEGGIASKENTPLKSKKSSGLIKSVNTPIDIEVADVENKTPSVEFKGYGPENKMPSTEIGTGKPSSPEAKSVGAENKVPSPEIKSLGEVKALDPEPKYMSPEPTFMTPEVHNVGPEIQYTSPDTKSAGLENKSLTNESKHSGTGGAISPLEHKVLSGEGGLAAKSFGGEGGAVTGAKSFGGEGGTVAGAKSFGGEGGQVAGAKSFGAESGAVGGTKSSGGEATSIGPMMTSPATGGGSIVPHDVTGESDHLAQQKYPSSAISEIGSGFLEKSGEKSISNPNASKSRAIKGPESFTPVGLDKGPSAFDTSAPPKTGTFACAAGLLQKRSPFIHNPPQPEERRARIQRPRTTREYIINLREDLADFQETHGLPRTRDYSFLSLGLALAQETGRAIYSVFLMFTELFPILAIVSLILRFALDKLIEILETPETIPKVKKSVIFALEMLAIMIPLWILIGTIIIPLLSLLLSIFSKMLRIRGGKRKHSKSKTKAPVETCGAL